MTISLQRLIRLNLYPNLYGRDYKLSALKISEVQPGHELAENVLFKDNIILFKSGEKITTKHLKALRAFGITEVEIADNSINADNKNNTDLITDSSNQLQKEIEFLFKHTDSKDAVINELKRLSFQLKEQMQ